MCCDRISSEDLGSDVGRSLFIKGLQEADSGRYTCAAVYTGSQRLEAHVNLTTIGELLFIDDEVRSGDDLWGSPLAVADCPNPGALLFAPHWKFLVLFWSLRGNASAESFRNLKKLFVVILILLLLLPVGITWEDAPTEQSAIFGRPYKVRCVVRANPPATIDWQKNGQSFTTSQFTYLYSSIISLPS